MNKVFTVAIEETCVKEFDVSAETPEQAITIAKAKYKNGVFVLDPGEVQFKQIAIINPQNERTKWIEF